jgi:hypothetical protein
MRDLCRGSGPIDEYEPGRIKLRPNAKPGKPPDANVRPLLLLGVRRFL